LPTRGEHRLHFAEVYDLLYGGQVEFLAAVGAFVTACIPAGGWVLDAGCGTGICWPHLRARGCEVVGMDLDLAMLRQARRRAEGAGVRRFQADLRAPLPLRATFDAVICMESPLGYLRSDGEVRACLSEFRRHLRTGGVLIVDVFDFPGTLGKTQPPSVRNWTIPGGRLVVREEHRSDARRSIWRMKQDFTLEGMDGHRAGSVTHYFRVRGREEWEQFLREAGFTIEGFWTQIPGVSDSIAGREHRMVWVASAG
jgi:SAM-dependent methyltransferase